MFRRRLPTLLRNMMLRILKIGAEGFFAMMSQPMKIHAVLTQSNTLIMFTLMGLFHLIFFSVIKSEH